jgi:hypothetical protein
MSIRQSVIEWTIAAAIGAPLGLLYIIGDMSDGWVRYVCWSVFFLSLLGIVVYMGYLYSKIWGDGDSL